MRGADSTSPTTERWGFCRRPHVRIVPIDALRGERWTGTERQVPYDTRTMRPLTSVDLFSGAGGLTEGFHQAGFQVLASLDNWRPAAETHTKNFPRTKMFHADILEFDPAELPEVDVLVGSPPCTQFSYANRGGHGDLVVGMRFVLRFLRFVHDLQPRYWAMENVPRLAQSLPHRIRLRRLGLNEDGFLDIPVRSVLNSADFGAPQKRLRLFSGKFPVPEPTHHSPQGANGSRRGPAWMTIQDVVGLLPDPLDRDRGGNVTDPNYRFEIPDRRSLGPLHGHPTIPGGDPGQP